jgi:glycosyltransferase involved in cell wall biosynthesis
MSDANAAPAVSVVIPSCNRCNALNRCLDALSVQTHLAYELIVIDDGSTDGTQAMVARFAQAHPHVQLNYLRNDVNRGANPSRNRGIAAARGGCVAFLDSDCIAAPDWLEKLTAAFSDQRVAAVTGLVNDQLPRNIYELAFKGTHRLHRSGPAHRLVAGNMCVRRDILARVMLDEDRAQTATAMPDLEVSGRGDEEGLYLAIKAAGLEMRAVPEAVVLHEHDYTRRSFFKQALRGGGSAARLVYKYYLPPRLDLLPLILAYLTLPLIIWSRALAIVPLVFFAAACAAIAGNELLRKGKSISETIGIFPVQLAYYHVRMFGYVRETLRLHLAGNEIVRVRLRNNRSKQDA